MVKLSDKWLAWYVPRAVKGRETPQVWAPKKHVTVRWLQIIAKRYRETGIVPTLNANRRPKGPALTDDEKARIEAARQDTKRGARKIWLYLRKQGIRIPKHKIHAYAQAKKWSEPNRNKQKKRNRTRYERDHPGSLLHADWHRTSEHHPHAIVWMDDASRFAIFGGEFPHENGENSIATFDIARGRLSTWGVRVDQVNTDRGSVFYTTTKEGHEEGFAQFELHLQSLGIEHVPSRAHNPQTNGKSERFWLEYDRHRWRFGSMQEFLDWYNDQIHDELWIDTQLGIYESPREALYRKLQPGVLLRLHHHLVESSAEAGPVEVIYAK